MTPERPSTVSLQLDNALRALEELSAGLRRDRLVAYDAWKSLHDRMGLLDSLEQLNMADAWRRLNEVTYRLEGADMALGEVHDQWASAAGQSSSQTTG